MNLLMMLQIPNAFPLKGLQALFFFFSNQVPLCIVMDLVTEEKRAERKEKDS